MKAELVQDLHHIPELTDNNSNPTSLGPTPCGNIERNQQAYFTLRRNLAIQLVEKYYVTN
jgi:hypothetical protein